MIKQLFRFMLHLLIIIVSLGAAAAGFLYWIGYFEHESCVAYLYEETAFRQVEINQMASLFAEEDAPFQSAPIYGQASDRVFDMIEKGANSIILNLEEAPTDELILLAAQSDVTLFFIGALPTEAQIASYDKIWCFAESPAYAGELLGEQVALGFREETIVDKNNDILLDLAFLTPTETYMNPKAAMDSALLELDHYGVYTTDVYDAAYQAALAAAELAAAQTETSDDAPEEGETAPEDAPLPEESTSSPDASLAVTVPLSDLASVEILMSVGYANATYLAEQAATLGWLDGDFPVSMACIAENHAAAAKLADTGLYQSIVYFDTAYATETVVTMACNAWAQTPVTNGTDFAETSDHIFTLPHKLY